MNISEKCKHKGEFKKDCCRIVGDYTIVEHDGCVNEGGCDVVAYNDERFYFIEIKGGKISSSDASKIVEQIKKCENFYNPYVGHRRKSRLFLHCNKKRLENYARIKLRREGIRIYTCKDCVNLNELD